MVFGAQFNTIENGSTVNYSSHTAWIRVDGLQPRLFRRDGLAFVPDPTVSAKYIAPHIKGFAAYRHLQRAKTRVSAAVQKSKRQTTGWSNQHKTEDSHYFSPSQDLSKTVNSTSPKSPPPNKIEEVIRQPLK